MIRKANEKDIPRLIELLSQVLEIHAKIRPDIFVSGKTKYTKEDLLSILSDEKKMIFVATDENDMVLGYAFCELKSRPASEYMVQFTSLFIDDLCVDEKARGMSLGKKLFEYVKKEAKKLGCYEVTLNVWEGNDSAKAFYDKMGMKAKETQMEFIL